MGCYSRLMVKHPFILILVDVILAFVLGPLTVWIFGLPNFSEPTQGFEPRGTKLHNWERVGWNIRHYKDQGKALTTHASLTSYPQVAITPKAPTRKKRAVASTKNELQNCATLSLSKLTYLSPRLVVTSKTGSNIFTASHMHSICRIADRLKDFQWKSDECFTISLPLIITALAQKTSCYDITDSDMREVTKLVQRCSVYYFKGILKPYCDISNECPLVPQECLFFNGAYMIIHILTDSGFMANGDTDLTNVDFSLLVIPKHWYDHDERTVVQFFYSLEGHEISDDNIVVTGMTMDITTHLFNAYVIGDVPWYVLAMSLVVVILLIYLQSIVLMAAVVSNVLISLCFSYFIYYYVCQLTFFPFINLVAALLLIAIGADDVFLIYDLWRQQLREQPLASYEEIMSETLRKGGMSIFVTSLTTAGALFSNMASSITTIRCFGIFAGICILVNFILMITWIPALIIIIEKTFNRCIKPSSSQKARTCLGKISKGMEYFWSVIMMNIITKCAPVWVLGYLAMGILGLIAIFVKPGLKLPEGNTVQIFSPDHPFEIYQSLYIDHIRFETELRFSQMLMLQVVWGADPTDTGDFLDPDKQAPLSYAPLEIFTMEAMTWMNKFCDQLKKQPFVTEQTRTHDCYFEVIERLLTGPCDVSTNDTEWEPGLDIRPCCGMTKSDIGLDNGTVLHNCMQHFSFLTNGQIHRIYGNPVLGEVLFDRHGQIKIFRYLFGSNRAISFYFEYIDELVKELESFVPVMMQTAPGTLKDGGYCSLHDRTIRLYNLQKAIAEGTMIGIAVAVATSFLVLLFTSMNILLALYAIITICLVISCTIGTLVMLGWHLNVTESLTITLSLGLAVDFTIHYGVAYKLSSGKTRAEKVKDVVKSVSSAVTMAALTTLLSGAAVLPGRVLAYRQFGMFLVFIMLFSWLFSTFFFLPLCYGIGPTGNVGNILYLLRCCCPKKKKSSESESNRSIPGRSGQSPAGSSQAVTESTTSLSSFQNKIFIKKPNSRSITPLGTHSSVDSKLRPSSEAITRLTPRLASGSQSSASNIIVMRDPLRKSASNANIKEEDRHRSRRRRNSYQSTGGTSQSGDDQEPNKTYIYNVHVYCVGGDVTAAVNADVTPDKKNKKRKDKEQEEDRFSY